MPLRKTLLIAAITILASNAFAGIATSYDDPDTVLANNTVIDIIEHNGYLWFTTPVGVNFTPDTGRTWLLYDDQNGLPGYDCSGIYSNGFRLWLATNHSQDVNGDLFDFSDGVTYTDDNGQNWTQVDFSPSGLNIPRIFGVDQDIYDISGHLDDDRGLDWVFFTAFAGGFLASQDGGTSWRRIFPLVSDSLNWVSNPSEPSLKNRYFSTKVDTSHGDTLIVWAGSAGGLVHNIYPKPGERLESAYINRAAFSDGFNGDLNSYVYLGGDNGVTRVGNRGVAIRTAGVNDGLPGPYVSALMDIGGRILAGTRQSAEGPSTGLAISSDLGETFTAPTFPGVVGSNRVIKDFATIRERTFMAAEEAGYFISNDTGTTWAHQFVDSTNTTTANRRNVVTALATYEDVLLLGTDSGTVFYFFDSLGAVDSVTAHVFPESFESSGRVDRIKVHEFRDTTNAVDSVVLWTINIPLTASGTRVIARSGDFGETWQTYRLQDTTFDIALINDTTYRVGPDGAEYARTGNDPNSPNTGIFRDRSFPDNLLGDTLTMLETRGAFIVIGTQDGYCFSFNGGSDFLIYRQNDDPMKPDRAVTYTAGTPGMAGEFIIALGTQYYDDQGSRTWVSCRPGAAGGTGLTLGLVVPLDIFGLVVHPDSLDKIVRYQLRWENVLPDVFAWNFGFNGDTVFAATDGGLLFNYADTGRTWDTVQFVDSLGNQVVDDNTSVLAATVFADKLWVGTTERTVIFDLATLIADTSFAYIDSTTPKDEVYAYPVPFSHTRHDYIKFRFVVEEATTVTIEVYDFAMNLVARVLDNEMRQPDYYQPTDVKSEKWNGLRDDGTRVAVGVYYFKVELGTGEVRWGKLAVMP